MQVTFSPESFPTVTFGIDDLKELFSLLYRRKRVNLFDVLSPEVLSRTLSNVTLYLRKDRVSEGLGQYGWGYSEHAMLRDLYGAVPAWRSPDSVQATAWVSQALLRYSDMCEQELDHRPELTTCRRRFVEELGLYLDERWDRSTGAGGVLRLDKHNYPNLVPSDRHTAWLLILWSIVPEWRPRCRDTARCLVQHFPSVAERAAQGNPDLVITYVSLANAFQLIERSEYLKGDQAEHEVLAYRGSALGIITGLYDHSISGWTDHNAHDTSAAARVCSLYVLTQMATVWNDTSSSLYSVMEKTLSAAMVDGWGLTPSENGFEASMSCLMWSALYRKDSVVPLTSKASKYFKNLSQKLMEHLGDESADLQGTYCWTLGCFLQDVCDYLMLKG